MVLNKTKVDVKELITKYISPNSYSSQVRISDLGSLEVNEILFCNAIENLIKNGLTYNKSDDKEVKIYMEDSFMVIEDNGVGFTQKQFDKQIKKYATDKESNQDEKGLGLNICLAIIKEHGYDLSCEKIDTGTKMKIKIN